MAPPPELSHSAEPPFEQPVILKRSPLWSRSLLWVLMGVTTFAITWASLAKMDEAIPAQGKLEPTGAVKDLQAPVGGVISDIKVQEGQVVKKGQPLVIFDTKTSKDQLKSLQQVKDSLLSETLFYKAQLGQTNAATPRPTTLSPNLATLAESRAALLQEIQLYNAQMSGQGIDRLTPYQRLRLATNGAERDSRENAARLEIDQLTQQLNQTQTRFANAQQQLASAQQQLDISQQQLRQSQALLTNAKQKLAIDERIYNDIKPVAEEGAIAKVQILRQEQEVTQGRSELGRQAADISSRLADISARSAEVLKQRSEGLQLQQEQTRLQLAIQQAQQKFQNTIAQSQQSPQGQISQAEQKLAEIDSQFAKLIVENDKRIQELDGQISQAQQTVKYQIIRAPIDGIVFDLKPKGPGYVIQTSEPILKVVPQDGFVAKVFITNRDIGFIQAPESCKRAIEQNPDAVKPNPDRTDGCMEVDVRIDSFPFSEFGDLKGVLTKIGSDALPPDQINQFYRFPAEIHFESCAAAQARALKGSAPPANGEKMPSQCLPVNNRLVALQSGMSITVNVKTRPRTVISYFIDLLNNKIDSLRSRQ